jgi:hypothetical protein
MGSLPSVSSVLAYGGLPLKYTSPPDPFVRMPNRVAIEPET